MAPADEDVETQPLHRERGRALCAGLLVPLGAVAWDLRRVLWVAPRVADLGGVVAFSLVGWALGSLLISIVLLLHAELAVRLSRLGPSGSALLGALEAFGLFVLAVVAHDPRALDMDARVWLLAGAAAGLASLRSWLARLSWAHKPALLRMVALASLAGAVLGLANLGGNARFTRLTLQIVAAVALSRLLPAVHPSTVRRVLVPALVAAALLALGSGLMLEHSRGGRLALHHKSINARTWMSLYEDLRGRQGGGVSRTLSSDAVSLTTEVMSRATAVGADVLVLSIDSLRWDAVDALPELRRALGPHVLFEHAYSPAPGTKESLAATLRGRPARTLRFEKADLARGRILWRDPSPTFAHALVRAAYRAVTVPTSNIAEPRNGVQSGFESIWVANYDARNAPPERSPFTQVFVPATQVTPIALQVARETRGPLCLWLHLMDTHASYHVSTPARAPESTHQRFERSVRELDARLAALVREVRAIRNRTLVLAVFGDHGEEFGEHGGEYHATTVYAEQVHVAFLLAAPGVAPGRQVAPVTTAQLPATLLELLGLAVPTSVTEPSLLGPLAGRAPWPELAVSEVQAQPPMVTAYTTSDYRYLHDPAHEVEMLFDARRDPLDQHDVAAQQPEALQRMRDLARAWDVAH